MTSMRCFCLLTCLVSGLLHLPSLAYGAGLERISSHPKLADQLRREWNHRLTQDAATLKSKGVRADVMPVILRLSNVLSPAEERVLADSVMELDTVDGVVAHVGPFYGAKVDVRQLSTLLANPWVERVFGLPKHLTRPLAPNNPYGKAYPWTHVQQLWNYRDGSGSRYLGQGVTLCDIDSMVDIFHPLLFHADGGYFAWVDVNGNGTFNVGVDGVDLDGNGSVAASEVLKKYGGGVLNDDWDITEKDAPYHTARHWLFQDANGNSKRDFRRTNIMDKTSPLFPEDTPAYGEPIFIADDVNSNGVLDVGEKLLRLKTTKFKGVYLLSSGTAYMRGENLHETPTILPSGEILDAMHGTAVTSTLAGGEPTLNWVAGLAPKSELLLIVQDAVDFQQSMVAALSWAKQLGTQVFVHEYGTPLGEYADGSSDWEQLLDTMTNQGTVQATAAHNFASRPGRARVNVLAGQTVTLDVVAQFTAFPYTSILGTLRWMGGQNDLEVTLTTPSTDVATLNAGQEQTTGRHVMTGSQTVSTRGTAMVDFTYEYLNSSGTGTALLPLGTYLLSMTNQSTEARDVFIYVTDDWRFSEFVGIDGEHDDTTSMAWPSTADSAIAVAAFRVNRLIGVDGTAQAEGDLADYSGRGPRINGSHTISIAAPADHFAAYYYSGEYYGGGGHYLPFDGTSGALPEVAGAIALLLSKEPQLTPVEVKSRLSAAGRQDSSTGTVPNDNWGVGRLDVPMLVLGESLPANDPPTLRIPSVVEAGLVNGLATAYLDASLTTDDLDALDYLSFRWDDDYDGTWDAGSNSPMHSIEYTALGTHWVLVEVEDSVGGASRQLVKVSVVEGTTTSSSGTSSSAQTSSSVDSSSTTASSSSSSGTISTSSSATTTTTTSAVIVVSSSAGVSSSSAALSSSSMSLASSTSVVASSSGTTSSGGMSSSSGTATSLMHSSSSVVVSSSSAAKSSSGLLASSSMTTTSSHVLASSSVVITTSSSKQPSTSQAGGSDDDDDDDDDSTGGCGNCAQTDLAVPWLWAVLLLVVRRRKR